MEMSARDDASSTSARFSLKTREDHDASFPVALIFGGLLLKAQLLDQAAGGRGISSELFGQPHRLGALGRRGGRKTLREKEPIGEVCRIGLDRQTQIAESFLTRDP